MKSSSHYDKESISSKRSHSGGNRHRIRIRRHGQWLRSAPPLLILLFFAALVRLFLWSWFSRLPSDMRLPIWDERDYHSLATNLVEYGEFSFALGEPISIRPPFYPFFLAFIYELFGLGSFQVARAVQAGLSLGTIVLLYDLGKRVYDRRTGLWVAGFYAFYPSLLVANNLILTEGLFTFFLIATAWALVRALQKESIVWLLYAGVFLGMGALTRSVLWLFIPLLSTYILIVWRGRIWLRFTAAGTLFLAAALIITPWAVRNTRLEKTFLTVDSMGGRNLMMGNYQYTPMHRSWDAISITGETSWDIVLSREEPTSLSATQGQKDKMAMRYGVKYALTHPFLTAQRDIVKFFDFWGLEREQIAGASQGFFGPMPKIAVWMLALIIVAGYIAGFFTGIFGAILTPPEDWRIFGLFLLVIAFVTGMHTLAFGHSRYHLPLMPLVLTFAGAAVRRAKQLWSSRGRLPFWLATAVCGVFALAWVWDLVAVEGDKLTQLFKS